MNKLMTIVSMAIIVSDTALSARGAVMCFGESVPVKLDFTTGVHTAATNEVIRFSADWVGGAVSGATAVVEVNGEVLNSTTGSGYVDWSPVSNGVFVLTHKIMSGSEQIGDTLTAAFIMDGLKAATPVFSPESGTIFDTSLSVSILCSTEGSVIHYTTDGSAPTLESSVYRRFRISGKTTIKAVAEKNGWYPSDVMTAEYALGQCDNPVITPGDGSTFEWAGEQIVIDWHGEDGVLRYTTDGRDPTTESPVYEGPFTISDTTIVKAKAFGVQFFDSVVITANITRVWTDVAIPQIEAANSFTGSKMKVSISCATEGATIRYTMDGSEPDPSSNEYTGPIYVTDSCTVKAYAMKYDYRDSAVATQEIAKVWSIGDTMGKPDHGFTTSGSDGGTGWTRVVDATAANGEAMKSGAITDNQTSILSTTVMGPGTLSFTWRTSCEDDPMYEWDHAEFVVDGTAVRQLCGETAWTSECVGIVGDGEHTVEWRYVKDNAVSEGEDAAWVAGYQWESAWTATRTTKVPVPYDWLIQHNPDVVDEYAAYEASAKCKAANPRYTMETAYVAGIDPGDPIADFTAAITFSNSVPMVTWHPDLNTNGIIRTYKVYGSETLEGGGNWQYPTNSLHRFFKVSVEMP